MKPFSFAELSGAGRLMGQTLTICCLAVLLAVSSCNKGTVGNKIVGNWKLVAYTGNAGGLVHVIASSDQLTLKPDHTYEVRSGSMVSSGAYRLDISTVGSRHALLSLSGQPYMMDLEVGFNGDTLMLRRTQFFVGWGQPMSKYVRM